MPRPDVLLSARRVLVFRALKLGDMMCAVPALRSLRKGLPAAEIVLAGLPSMQHLLERYRNYLDGFRAFAGYPGLPEQPYCARRTLDFLRAIQAEGFDLAIQMHGSGAISNAVTAFFGAKRTAGFFVPGSFCPDPELYCPYPDHGLEIRRLLTLVRFLGLETGGEDLEFPLYVNDYDALRTAAGELPRHGGYVCLHPGASVPERRWPAERFTELGRFLARLGLRVVLTGSAEEAHLTGAVAKELGSAALDLAGRTDLGALAALVDGARLLVSNDTGVSHLAAALKTPSVVISTGDNPQRWAPSDTRRHRVLCSAAGVEAGDVIAQAEALLNEGGEPAFDRETRMETTACARCAS